MVSCLVLTLMLSHPHILAQQIFYSSAKVINSIICTAKHRPNKVLFPTKNLDVVICSKTKWYSFSHCKFDLCIYISHDYQMCITKWVILSILFSCSGQELFKYGCLKHIAILQSYCHKCAKVNCIWKGQTFHEQILLDTGGHVKLFFPHRMNNCI